jgi:formate hydrogenlyase subunit 3/multisubunit Na+/H+ antiporter MnhD subunit
MLLVVTCQNALVFLISWEIMSLSSFFLVVFESEKKEVLNAGIKYLVFMHISVIFIILAFATCSISSGSFNFSDFKEILSNNTHLANIVFALFFCGFATKAGLVPFHNHISFPNLSYLYRSVGRKAEKLHDLKISTSERLVHLKEMNTQRP